MIYLYAVFINKLTSSRNNSNDKKNKPKKASTKLKILSYVALMARFIIMFLLYSVVAFCNNINNNYNNNNNNNNTHTLFSNYFQITNLTEFVHLAQEGMELARLLRLNLSFTEGLQNKSRHERNKIYFHEMWKNVGPIICGPDPEEQPSQNVVNHMYDYDCRTTACKTRAMRLMIYLLLHNPTILYSPNGTAADEIIKKVSETFWQIKYIIFILLRL